MKALGLVVLEKIFFSHDAPGAGPVWSQGARLARFIKRTTIHCYTQNMKALGLVVSEIFLCFSVVCLWELMTPRAGPFSTLGAWLAGFLKRTSTHCYIQNKKALGLVVLEKIFFYVFSMTPPGRALMDPRGMIGRIYKNYHNTLLHKKYESSGPCGFGEEDCLFFP